MIMNKKRMKKINLNKKLKELKKGFMIFILRMKVLRL